MTLQNYKTELEGASFRMELSRRLKAVAKAVTRGNVVADVGCDHAYISIYLIQEGYAPSVIAMDVNKGPLQRAKDNIKLHGYEQNIQTRLSNGLEKLNIKEADTILLAGMGGNLMTQILEEGSEVVKQAKELVLQPQSEISDLRRYLHSIGYEILSEEMLIDVDKYYVVIKSKNVGQTIPYEKEIYYLFGKNLLEERNLVLRQYLLKEKKQRDAVMIKLANSSSEQAIERMEEIKQEINYLKEGLEYWL